MGFTDVSTITTADAMFAKQLAQELYDALEERITWFEQDRPSSSRVWSWSNTFTHSGSEREPATPTASEVELVDTGGSPPAHTNATAWYRWLQRRCDEFLDATPGGSSPGYSRVIQLHSTVDGSRLSEPLTGPTLAAPDDEPFGYASKADFMLALSKGASSAGWRRTDVHPDDPAFAGWAYGTAQAGDVFGWWIIEDLQRWFALTIAERVFESAEFEWATNIEGSGVAYGASDWAVEYQTSESIARTAYGSASEGSGDQTAGISSPGKVGYLYDWEDVFIPQNYFFAEGESFAGRVRVDGWDDGTGNQPARTAHLYWAPIAVTDDAWSTMSPGIDPDDLPTETFDDQGESGLPSENAVTHAGSLSWGAGDTAAKELSSWIPNSDVHTRKPSLGDLDELLGFRCRGYGYVRYDVVDGFEYV